MFNRMIGVVATVVVSFVCTAPGQAQNAVQWRVEAGGNGHWYALRDDNGTWLQARAAAEARGGHMAAVTSAEENSFLWSTLTSSAFYPCFAMLGGYQDTSAPGYSEPAGGWRWVTDEPFSYTAWYTIEPNDGPGAGAEDYLSFREFDCAARWNDIPDVVPNTTYFVEFEADCNNDGIVDYGQIRAGEYADVNANNIPDCCEYSTPCDCNADIIQDNAINGVDLAAIMNAWGTDGGKIPRCDVDGSGIVDGTDLTIVLDAWGPCP